LCAKDLVKCRDYSLQTLVETQLQQERTPLDYERVRDYLCTPEQLVYLLRHCEKDAFFQAMLLFQLMVLPLTKQLTAIAGNLWSRTLVGGRAERNELLLLHEFHDQKYICPDKPQQINSTNAPPPPLQDDEDEEEAAVMTKSKSGRRKPTYAGGLVLQPKKGLYDNIVLLLDFNSLYPSIIQEFNICFTTIERDYSSTEAAERMPSPPESGTPQGLLPKILASLVNRRRQIKTMMKDPKISPGGLAQLQIRQQALKLTANSMYGCLGFAHSRFFARPLAMLITAKGREILQHTVDVAQSQCRLDVVYGDTDSIMVHTGTRDLAEARKTGQLLKKAVNEHYRLLEIELDGVFERLLLLKKKKYAAVVLEERADGTVIRKVEIKGLDLVRRDWCALSVDTSNAVLARILRTDESAEDGDAVVEGIHRILREMAAAVGEDTVPLEKYVITKNLTKEPEQYADIKSQPHVAVALQMRERGIAVRAGETIPYVICKTNSGNAGGTLAERAFHPDQVKKEHLVVDKEWYLAQQIHPCVARLCEHLAGTDIARLAGCLGLDSAKYHAVHRGNGEPGEEEFKTLSAFLTDEEKFRNVEKVSMCCPTCEVSFEFRGLATVVDGKVQFVLDCASCGQRIPMLSLYYQLAQAIRSATNSYYMGWLECDEPACRARIRLPRVYEQRCPVDTCRGGMRPLVSGQMLYHQLLYYRSLVDMDRVKTASGMDGKWRAVAAESEPLKELVDRTLSKCAYPIIHLGEIFSFVSIKSPL
jgi:DNA polymerase alpha subunit A